VVEEDLGSEVWGMSPKLKFSSSPLKKIPHNMCLRYIVTKLLVAKLYTVAQI